MTIGDEVPVAAAQLVSHTPLAGASTTFASAGSKDLDGHIVSYMWAFGDGTYGTGAHPTHTYKSAGPYTVVLTVVGSGGDRGSAQLSITVVVPGRITRVQARAGSAGPTVIVSVNRPGRLRVDNHTVNIHAAGSTPVQLRLSSGQQRALAASKTVRIQTRSPSPPTPDPPAAARTRSACTGRATRTATGSSCGRSSCEGGGAGGGRGSCRGCGSGGPRLARRLTAGRFWRGAGLGGGACAGLARPARDVLAGLRGRGMWTRRRRIVAAAITGACAAGG